MAFDAGMLAAVIHEIRTAALGARMEKITQPEKDEIILQMRSFEGGRRLLIHAGSSNPRMCFTELNKENPPSPPMLCMLLRKHLSGAKLSDIRQEGFERVARLEFETRDEMGFACRRYLVAEIMGKYSNLMFTDEKGKILAALRPVDFSTSSLRQVLPGMTYELPPAQEGKMDPTLCDAKAFAAAYAAAPEGKPLHKWLLGAFLGISAAVAREIVYLATGDVECPPERAELTRLWAAFDGVMSRIREGHFEPTLYLDGERPVEYAFMPLTQYGSIFAEVKGTAGEILDRFFATRDREARVKQHAADILHILTNAESRLHKKLDLQRGELADCERGAEYKKLGDLITANLYALSRGMSEVTLTDYEDYHEDGSYGECTVTLDSRLSPTANAQLYYKKYNKSKTAREELTRQIALGEQELTYVYSVFDALTHAETDADLAEIRDELYRSGYASRMKQYRAPKAKNPVVAQFIAPSGRRILCGKNNVQNEYITHKLADKNDYWFHAKGVPGSHVLLVCNGEEPEDEDFTLAAEIAAHYSKAADGQNVAVDYTLARHVKKVANGKPGLVIYHTNWTAYVTPDAERIAGMRVAKK